MVKLNSLMVKTMHKIGHRGAKGYVAENTLASFQKALDFDVDGIELDVYLCKSGEVVVIHDDTIDRTTSGKGFVKSFTAKELAVFGIPTLEAVFELINQACDSIITKFVPVHTGIAT